MTKEKYSRRALLKTLGVGAGMLPLIQAERTTAATPSGYPKRFISIMRSGGVRGEAFYPQETGEDFTVGQIIAPLAQWKSKMILPVGLDFSQILDLCGGPANGAQHAAYPSVLTGNVAHAGTGCATSPNLPAAGPSIDQIISDDIARKPNPPPVPLLNLGGVQAVENVPTSYRGAGVKNTPYTSPQKAFDRVFGGTNLPPAEIDKLRNHRQSVLDALKGDLGRFRSRLGTEDRHAIDAHLDSVRAIELQLQAAPVSTTCAKPMLTPPPASSGAAPALATSMKIPSTAKSMFDIIAAAIRCDLTRVVTFDMNTTGGDTFLPWLTELDALGFSSTGTTYHAVQHAGGSNNPQKPSTDNAKKAKLIVDSWHYIVAAGLVQQLDATREGTGTTLDNCSVLMSTDTCGDHGTTGIPYVMLGSCGGVFKTGRQVRLGNYIGKTGEYWAKQGGLVGGVPHNRLLTSICRAMDVNISSVGADGYGGDIDSYLRA